MQPLISVVIPTYNRAELVLKAIKSVLNQTYTNFELLVCDDGSTEDTEEAVKSIKDSRILYLKQENKGLPGARNLGLKNAKGEFIAILDDDDQWMPNHLEYCIEFFELYPEADLVYTQSELFFADGTRRGSVNYKKLDIPHQEKKKDFRFYEGLVFDYYLHYGELNTPSCTVIRKRVFDEIGYYDERLKIMPDNEMAFRISNKFRIGVVRKSTVRYLAHSESISEETTKPKELKEHLLVCESIKKNCSLDKKQEQFVNQRVSKLKEELSNL